MKTCIDHMSNFLTLVSHKIADLFMHSLPGMILLYLAALYTKGVFVSVVLVPQNHFSLILVLVLHFEIILVNISSSIPSSQ